MLMFFTISILTVTSWTVLYLIHLLHLTMASYYWRNVFCSKHNNIKSKVSRVLFRRCYFDLEQLRSGQVKIKLLEFTRKFIVCFWLKFSKQVFFILLSFCLVKIVIYSRNVAEQINTTKTVFRCILSYDLNNHLDFF